MKELIFDKETGLVRSSKTFFFRDAYGLMVYLEGRVRPDEWSLEFNKMCAVGGRGLNVHRLYENGKDYLLFCDDLPELEVGCTIKVKRGIPEGGISPSPIMGRVEVRRFD